MELCVIIIAVRLVDCFMRMVFMKCGLHQYVAVDNFVMCDKDETPRKEINVLYWERMADMCMINKRRKVPSHDLAIFKQKYI